MTDQVSDRILDKIAKVLALANDERGDQTTRETAMRQAYALLAKHNLSLADIDGRQPGGPGQERVEVAFKNIIYPWARHLAQAISQLFFTKYLYVQGAGKSATYYFIGRQDNALTAQYITEYVIKSVFAEQRRLFRSTTNAQARSFATGVAQVVAHRCFVMRREAEAESAAPSTGRALVLASLYTREQEENDAFVKAMYGDVNTAKDRSKEATDRAAYHAGREHGRAVNLSRQVTHDTREGRKLLK